MYNNITTVSVIMILFVNTVVLISRYSHENLWVKNNFEVEPIMHISIDVTLVMQIISFKVAGLAH